MVRKSKTYVIDGIEYRANKRVFRVNTGWQVRFDKKGEKRYTRLFSDKRYNSIKKALSNANKHARTVEATYQKMQIPEDEVVLSHLSKEAPLTYPDINALKEEANLKYTPQSKTVFQTEKPLSTLIQTFKDYDIISIRRFELLAYLREPRTPKEIESALGIHYQDMNKFYKRMKPLIEKSNMKQKQRERGKLPVIYSLSPSGEEAVNTVIALLLPDL